MIGAHAMQSISDAADRCEYWLAREAQAREAGDVATAADLAQCAEAEANTAFYLAGDRSLWARQTTLFPAPPAQPRSPCRGVAGAGGDSIESGRAGVP
jgi:hypothetical protein